MWPNGKGQMLVSTQKEPPSYERLLSLLRKVPGSKSARSWVERVLRPDWISGDGGLAPAPAASSPGTQAGTALSTAPQETQGSGCNRSCHDKSSVSGGKVRWRSASQKGPSQW